MNGTKHATVNPPIELVQALGRYGGIPHIETNIRRNLIRGNEGFDMTAELHGERFLILHGAGPVWAEDPHTVVTIPANPDREQITEAAQALWDGLCESFILGSAKVLDGVTADLERVGR